VPRIPRLPVLAVLSLLAGVLPARALTPVHQWSKSGGDTVTDRAEAIAFDGDGNVYVTGSFEGTINLGGTDLVGLGGEDVFVASYDAAGVHRWSVQAGGTGTDRGISITVDAADNVIVGGDFEGTAIFPVGALVSAGSSDLFIMKLTAAGAQSWAVRYGTSTTEQAPVLATGGGSSDIFVAGIFTGTTNLGGGNLVSAGNYDTFLARVDKFGAHIWSQRFGGTGTDGIVRVGVDAAGSITTSGYFSATVSFGGGNLVSAGGIDAFVARHSGTGTHLWSQRFGSTAGDNALGLALDDDGSFVLTGYFSGSVSFGGAALLSAGSADVFLAGYDASGAHLWSQRFGGAALDNGVSVAADASGRIYLTGYYNSPGVNFGGGVLPAAGSADAFLAAFEPDGSHRWSRSFGGALNEFGMGVALADADAVAMAGSFESTVNFGGGNLVSNGLDDVFVTRYDANPAEPVITSVADIGNDQGRKVKIRFERSGHDQPLSSSTVLQYEAFRRDDLPPAALHGPSGPTTRELLADGWTQVGVVAAHEEASYGIDVPTVGDSTETLGQYHSVFYIRAATAAPGTFYDSPADSGYSVDNLAPGIPGSLLYSSGMLSWTESPAEDFDYFTVYGAAVEAFGSAAVVDYTVAPSMDVTASPYDYYFVTATDFSGNEGAPITVNTLSGVGGGPRSYVLSVSNFPNPFNPRTTIRYTVPSRGEVTIAIYDARGARVAVLAERVAREAGAYRVEWDGRSDNGLAASSGVYFVRIVHGDATQNRKMVLLK
jgi:hypothetical protein